MERHQRLVTLIREDPEAVLEQRLPWDILQNPPVELEAALERPVETRGDLVRMFACTGHGPGDTHHECQDWVDAKIGERYVRASVYGRRRLMNTRMDVAFYGVEIDGVVAVHDSPLREVEPGERAYREGWITLGMGEEVHRFRTEEAANEFEHRLMWAEARANGPFVTYDTSMTPETP